MEQIYWYIVYTRELLIRKILNGQRIQIILYPLIDYCRLSTQFYVSLIYYIFNEVISYEKDKYFNYGYMLNIDK